MKRMTPLAPEALDDEQRKAYDEAVGGRRGRMPAPMQAWIRSPELARRAQRLGEFTRYETQLGPSLSELAILVTARYWNAQYEWYVHAKEALKAGLDPAIIEDISNHRQPHFADRAHAVVHAFSLALHLSRQVPEALYAEAVELLGERKVVELVGLLGYYTMVSMTLNVFDIGVPEGEADPLPP
ncbi:MAG: carboxymuconolactone decarboxylase family protein [Herminiimonas sp.]|nr:carboxymuconolactone decarboxylase family protein [Herminiimonas sp.]